MDRWVRCWAGAIGTLASIGLSGCATGPDPEVARAQAAVQEARDDQAVSEYAPEALRDAEQALVQAEQGQRQGLDDEEVDHLAYVAEQKAAIAQSQAVEQRSQDELLQQLRAERTSRGMVVTLEDVLFEVNGSALQPGAQAELLRLADYLKRNPDRNIMIEGHTDNSGGSEYNLQLSQLRAQSVSSYLVAERRASRSHPGHRLWGDAPRSAERQRYWPSTKSPGRDRDPGCGRVVGGRRRRLIFLSGFRGHRAGSAM